MRVVARDAALRANEAVAEKTVSIDLTPPTLELVADDRYVNFGGVGVLVYLGLIADQWFAIVVARFNDFVVDPLVRGAVDALAHQLAMGHGRGDQRRSPFQRVAPSRKRMALAHR